MSNDLRQGPGPVDVVDVRGPRFVAWVTTAVLIATRLVAAVSSIAAAVVFARGARGANPYARLYRPRTPPRELEDAKPPRFAQLVGLVFAVAGLGLFALGATTGALIATAAALSAALLNAAFGLCLGCELYLLIKRITHRHEGATA